MTFKKQRLALGGGRSQSGPVNLAFDPAFKVQFMICHENVCTVSLAGWVPPGRRRASRASIREP